MRLLHALGSGAAGACAITLLHETARRLIPHAPRMDVLGERVIARTMRALDRTPPSGDRLHRAALAGDLVFNTLYYALVGIGARRLAWVRGALLGLIAGIGGVLLPRPLGLGRQPDQRTPLTQALTMLWYLTGGLAAAAAARRSSETRGQLEDIASSVEHQL